MSLELKGITKKFGSLVANDQINLKVEKILPMKFDAYYVSLLSEKYKCGSMKPISALYRGFVSNIKAIKSKQFDKIIFSSDSDKYYNILIKITKMNQRGRC